MPQRLKGVTFVVVTFNGYWGKGSTLTEALKNCGPAFPAKAGVYRFPHELVDPESIEVNGHGGVTWQWAVEAFHTLRSDVVTLGVFEISKRRTLEPVEDV